MTKTEATAWFHGHDSVWLRPEATNPYSEESPSLRNAWTDGRITGQLKRLVGMTAKEAGVTEPRKEKEPSND